MDELKQFIASQHPDTPKHLTFLNYCNTLDKNYPIINRDLVDPRLLAIRDITWKEDPIRTGYVLAVSPESFLKLTQNLEDNDKLREQSFDIAQGILETLGFISPDEQTQEVGKLVSETYSEIDSSEPIVVKVGVQHMQKTAFDHLVMVVIEASQELGGEFIPETEYDRSMKLFALGVKKPLLPFPHKHVLCFRFKK